MPRLSPCLRKLRYHSTTLGFCFALKDVVRVTQEGHETWAGADRFLNKDGMSIIQLAAVVPAVVCQ